MANKDIMPSLEELFKYAGDKDRDFMRETLALILKKLMKDFTARLVVVMESTGHYHKILFDSLCKAGFEVSVINPLQTDSIKNLGIRKVKSDKVDALRIALLYRFQELKTTNILDG